LVLAVDQMEEMVQQAFRRQVLMVVMGQPKVLVELAATVHICHFPEVVLVIF
jgi:hypothetical protein